jgi:hypothetical protein
LGKSQSHRQSAAAFVAKEKKGMTKTVVPDQLNQVFFYPILPDDLCK